MRNRVVLEAARPLSQSSIWRAQENFYQGAGPNAWSSGEVPHTLTSGPLLARAYAEIVTGFLLDAAACAFGEVDLEEPFYLVELGAGTGRFAFHLLRALDRCQDLGCRVVYVLTDSVPSNLAFWRDHPRLLPLFDSGRLDLARFDATTDSRLVLERSRRILAAGSSINPIVVIANYLFDVIPQDLFTSEDGTLAELRVALVSDDAALDPTSPELFSHVWITTERAAVVEQRYAEPDLAELLHEIGAEPSRPNDRFLFPAAALGCIGRLGELADSRMLLLVGERPGGLPEVAVDSSTATEALTPGALLGMGVHGRSCSLPVDLGIVARYFSAHGGTSLLPEASPAGLLVAAFVVGAAIAPPTLRQRFAAVVNEGGPEDIFLALRATLDRGTAELPLALVLALLRVSGYDPYLLRELYGALERLLPGAVPAGVEESLRVLREVAAREYPIDPKTDVNFGVALLFAKSGHYLESLELLRGSRELHGPRPYAAFNEALCLLHLERVDDAIVALNETLELDAHMESASSLLAEVLAHRAADGTWKPLDWDPKTTSQSTGSSQPKGG